MISFFLEYDNYITGENFFQHLLQFYLIWVIIYLDGRIPPANLYPEVENYG